MKKTLESRVERHLNRACIRAVILCYKWTSPAQAGVPDRILIYKGVVRFVEMKRPGGYVTPLQKYHLDRLEAAGAITHVIDSMARVDELIEHIIK